MNILPRGRHYTHDSYVAVFVVTYIVFSTAHNNWNFYVMFKKSNLWCINETRLPNKGDKYIIDRSKLRMYVRPAMYVILRTCVRQTVRQPDRDGDDI